MEKYQDYLSEDMEQETIGNMSVGDVGYTVHWAVFADKNRKLWINTKYDIFEEAGSKGTTIQLKVKRMKDFFAIDVNSIDGYKWQPEEPHYVGQKDSDFAPCSIALNGF